MPNSNDANSKRIYKVFVSSTYLDNVERRKIVRDSITMAGMVWHGMEIFTASTRPTVEECTRLAGEADLLVGIIAWRYGWEPEGEEKSITELEYDAAKERLMFQIDPSLPVNPEKDFDPDPDTWDKQKKLAALKNRISKDQMPTIFRDTTLGVKVLDALNKWREQKEGRIDEHGIARRSQDKILLDEYLEDVIVANSRIDIQGISSMSGAGRELIYFPIEEHFTPLKTSSEPVEFRNLRDNENLFSVRDDRTPLTDLLSAHRRLLIIGDPGGGKTTFMRLIACVLAKDCQGLDNPGRKKYLGLPLENPPPTPILIRFSSLARTLKETPAEVEAGGSWRVLLKTMERLFGREKTAILKDLLDGGRCALLLDGLDEEADLNIRKQMVEVANAIFHYWGDKLIKKSINKTKQKMVKFTNVFLFHCKDKSIKEISISDKKIMVKYAKVIIGQEEPRFKDVDINNQKEMEESAQSVLDYWSEHSVRGADIFTVKKMAKIADAVLNCWMDNVIVFTSRPFGYQAISAIEGMATAHIDSFGDKEILEFLTRWASALFPSKEERRRKAYLPELKSAVLNAPRIRRMAKNPVMLTCLCVVHWNEKRLPEGKADLLAAVLRWLLNAKEEKRKERGYTNTFAAECFKTLALAMTNHSDGKQVNADLAWAAEQLAVPFLDELGVQSNRLRRKGMDFLEAEMLDSGIVEQAGLGQLRFWHYTFQEHYAARAIMELGAGEGPDGWWNIVSRYLDDRQWDEVLDHFAGCLARTGRGGLNFLVERVLGTAIMEDLASVARAVGVLGRILRILEVYDYKPPSHVGWEEVRNRVMDIFELEGASHVPVEQRIAAAEALGRAGDSRFNSLEPEMLPIPGMPNVLLGKYPVTVEEYQRFVDGGGYNDTRHWGKRWEEKEKREWIKPRDWEEQIENLNWPVTGVSWYEATAYCNWLSQRSEYTFRLPKSDEWEKAATNPKGGYPWGNEEPDKDRLNFGDNVGKPTPVGIYPAGAGPNGHLDMGGNVWEWNHDSFEEGVGRVIRSGSWNTHTYYCRSAICNYNPSNDRCDSVGFRLVRSLES